MNPLLPRYLYPLSIVSFALTASFSTLLAVSFAKAQDTAPSTEVSANASSSTAAVTSEEQVCADVLKTTVRRQNLEQLSSFCKRVSRLNTCSSTEGRPIQHVESLSTDTRGKRILVLGLIHGDEPLAGEMALIWAERLNALKTGYRNSWRIIPMLNPDGAMRRTRMNARGVDLNRNFPTRDWPQEALAFWKNQGKEDPRRYPGEGPASEVETKCVLDHIKDFKPDFIVSVHTPYRVLDFDGPQMSFPNYKDLPWKALGNFPGSLGRFMWKDYQIPVLTVELGMHMVDAAQLQDVVGSFAIEASRRSGKKVAASSPND